MLWKTPFVLRKRAGDPDRTGPAAHAGSPVTGILINLHFMALPSFATVNAPNPTTRALREPPLLNIAGERDEVLAQGLWITCARRLCGQELVEARPIILLAVTAALSRKECERAAAVIKAAVTEVLARWKRVRLLPPELSLPYACPIPIHIAYVLPPGGSYIYYN